MVRERPSHEREDETELSGGRAEMAAEEATSTGRSSQPNDIFHEQSTKFEVISTRACGVVRRG